MHDDGECPVDHPRGIFCQLHLTEVDSRESGSCSCCFGLQEQLCTPLRVAIGTANVSTQHQSQQTSGPNRSKIYLFT